MFFDLFCIAILLLLFFSEYLSGFLNSNWIFRKTYQIDHLCLLVMVPSKVSIPNFAETFKDRTAIRVFPKGD